MKKLSLIATLLLFSSVANAGVFTYAAASDAASSARRAEEAAKSNHVAVRTGPKSMMCDYEDGHCKATHDQTVYNLKAWYGLKYFGYTACSPEQYVTATVGHKINRIVSITYVYLGNVKAVIEYE